MFKKLNIILIFFFSVLTVKLNIGYTFFLPLLLFFVLKDSKNIYYTYIPSLVAVALIDRSYLVSLLIILVATTIVVFILTKTNNKSKIISAYPQIIIGLFITIMNVLMSFVFKITNTQVAIVIMTYGVSLLLYMYLERFLVKMLKDKSGVIQMQINSLAYMEVMISFVAILGAANISYFDINFGFLLGVFWSMYFGRKYKNIYALVYGVLTMVILFVGFDIFEALFIPFITSLYFITNILLMLVLNVFFVIVIFSNTPFETISIIAIMALSIIYEIIGKYLTNEPHDEEEVCEYIYNQIQNSTTNEILNFALFLDKFSQAFQHPKEYNERVSEGIKSFVNNQCFSCNKKKECFSKHKQELYVIFKSLLTQEANFRQKYPEFLEYCPKVNSFEHTAKMFEPKLNSRDIENSYATNHILISQITGLSNAIKKYVLDLSSKKEISYYKVMAIKSKLIQYGYDVSYFEVCKLFENDFLLKIGIRDQDFEDIKTSIGLISSGIIDVDVSVVKENIERNTIYVAIMPKLKIDITYGYGALSSDGETICGDNYLIKETNSGHFVSAISDGMGKGYRAFYESDTTLKLVDDIIKLNLESSTSLEILNNFYAIQDYLEQYATLDLIEINRYKKSANFYKMGATTTYIFRDNGTVDKIINKSLPFGLEEDIEKYEYNLENGDLILMSSDGVFENILDEVSMEGFIREIKELPPQKIVYELLNYTINHKIKTKDDMSIIALKVQTV